MSTQTTTLLRRTLITLGAAVGLAAGTQVAAQGTVTLSGAAGNSCQYSQMTVQPNGNITVNCGSTPTNPSVATFALSHPNFTSSTVAPNTSGTATVTRTGGPGEAIMLGYSVSGSGCNPLSGGMMMVAGASMTIPFSVGAAGTTCVVTIGATGHTASPNSITFTAQSGTAPPVDPDPNPPTTPGDCPAIPLSSRAGDAKINDFQSVDHRQSSSPGSGNILYYQVPASINAGSVKVAFDQGQTGSSPPGTTEFQVSPCPGVWDPPGHTIASQCRFGPNDAPNQVFTIWTAPAMSIQNVMVSGQAQLQYLCYAPIATRPYYINIRHVYNCAPVLANGYPGCGHSMKWRAFNSNGLYD